MIAEPQRTLSEVLAQVGRSKDAQDVQTITDPWLLKRYSWIAIENASPETRFDVAHRIKLAIDDPANGGPGYARDYEIRQHPHPMIPGETIYRIYNDQGEPAGLMHWERDRLLKAAMQTYVVRNIIYNDNVITPWPSGL